MNQFLNICEDPDWFPSDIDVARKSLSFVRTTRSDVSSAPFLDERFTEDRRDVRFMPIKDAQSALAQSRPNGEAAFIFHTAFCCSTLLASVLDRPGRVLSLKEPGVLMSLANVRRTEPHLGHSDSQFQGLANTVLVLLARRFSAEESVLIKPTNAANILLEAVLSSGARVLLLYSDLPGFLVSVIKKGEAGRYFMRHLLNIFRLDRPDIDAWPERQRMLLTDLQVTALVWNIQIELFEAIVQAAGEEQVRTLHADQFLDNTLNTLKGTTKFLGLGYNDDEIVEIADGPQFRRHSKFSAQDYDSSMRKAERAAVEEQYSEEIATTIEWAMKLRNDDLPSRLGHSI